MERFDSAATSAGLSFATRSATAEANAWKVGVLGDEVGLGVHLDQRAQLGVAGEEGGDRAVGGHAARGLARLGAALDAQQLLGLLDVAAGFFQRLLAFHHAEPGELAQFLDHRLR
jgi:hypothetical protein